ncbi:hypothetical protein KFE25_004623 [Diacronema lutheri]|uniref:BUB1 N-terminal domain-containing protein n=1 Tax=Diacronema lutheri TaxID=2081491 RepID=A0A8J5XJS7_DIALT|nr:hypothetical protein KFE25_004623 [Diacronema lutheri]
MSTAPTNVASPQAPDRALGEEHTWELSKENVVPVRRGHKAAALETLAPPSAVRAPPPPSLEADRQRFETELRTADDPLGVWVRYVRWSEDAYPTNAAAAPTLALLERCTRSLMEAAAPAGTHGAAARGRYHDDVRFLKLWVAYADRCHEPDEIFRFLRANEVGLDHALLWEAWAAVLEARRELQRADETFEAGVARRAQPLDHLRARHGMFQQRMTRAIAAQMAAGTDAASVGAFAPAPARAGGAGGGDEADARPALNRLSRAEAKHSHRPIGERRAPAALRGAQQQQQPRAAPPPPAGSASFGLNFQIFEDGDVGAGGAPAGASVDGGGGWKFLAPEREATKENGGGQAQPWVGQQLAQPQHQPAHVDPHADARARPAGVARTRAASGAAPAAPAAPSFALWADPTTDACAPPRAADGAGAALRLRAATEGGAGAASAYVAAVQAHPLLHFGALATTSAGAAVGVDAASRSPARAGAAGDGSAAAPNGAARAEVGGFDATLLRPLPGAAGHGCAESSFEEARAFARLGAAFRCWPLDAVAPPHAPRRTEATRAPPPCSGAQQPPQPPQPQPSPQPSPQPPRHAAAEAEAERSPEPACAPPDRFGLAATTPSSGAQTAPPPREPSPVLSRALRFGDSPLPASAPRTATAHAPCAAHSAAAAAAAREGGGKERALWSGGQVARNADGGAAPARHGSAVSLFAAARSPPSAATGWTAAPLSLRCARSPSPAAAPADGEARRAPRVFSMADAKTPVDGAAGGARLASPACAPDSVAPSARARARSPCERSPPSAVAAGRGAGAARPAPLAHEPTVRTLLALAELMPAFSDETDTAKPETAGVETAANGAGGHGAAGAERGTWRAAAGARGAHTPPAMPALAACDVPGGGASSARRLQTRQDAGCLTPLSPGCFTPLSPGCFTPLSPCVAAAMPCSARRAARPRSPAAGASPAAAEGAARLPTPLQPQPPPAARARALRSPSSPDDGTSAAAGGGGAGGGGWVSGGRAEHTINTQAAMDELLPLFSGTLSASQFGRLVGTAAGPAARAPHGGGGGGEGGGVAEGTSAALALLEGARAPSPAAAARAQPNSFAIFCDDEPPFDGGRGPPANGGGSAPAMAAAAFSVFNDEPLDERRAGSGGSLAPPLLPQSAHANTGVAWLALPGAAGAADANVARSPRAGDGARSPLSPLPLLSPPVLVPPGTVQPLVAGHAHDGVGACGGGGNRDDPAMGAPPRSPDFFAQSGAVPAGSVGGGHGGGLGGGLDFAIFCDETGDDDALAASVDGAAAVGASGVGGAGCGAGEPGGLGGLGGMEFAILPDDDDDDDGGGGGSAWAQRAGMPCASTPAGGAASVNRVGAVGQAAERAPSQPPRHAPQPLPQHPLMSAALSARFSRLQEEAEWNPATSTELWRLAKVEDIGTAAHAEAQRGAGSS